MNTNYHAHCNKFNERAYTLFDEWSRKNYGKMSQPKVSQFTGIPQPIISKIKASFENPKETQYQPPAETLLKIAEAFNVSTDYLLGLTDTQSTDKATKELCSTLGLSELTIDILTGNPHSPIANYLRGIYTKDMRHEAEIESKDLEELVEGELESVLDFFALNMSAFFNFMADDYAQSFPHLANDRYDYSKYPFVELFRRLNALIRSKDSSIKINFAEVDSEDFYEQDFYQVSSKNGISTSFFASPKELMTEATVNHIIAKLNDIKSRALSNEGEEKETK